MKYEIVLTGVMDNIDTVETHNTANHHHEASCLI